MKYRISSSRRWDSYQTLEDYPCLKYFELETVTGDGEKQVYVIINTIEDLMKLLKSVECSIIIHDDYEGEDYTIEIYDGWRE